MAIADNEPNSKDTLDGKYLCSGSHDMTIRVWHPLEENDGVCTHSNMLLHIARQATTLQLHCNYAATTLQLRCNASRSHGMILRVWHPLEKEDDVCSHYKTLQHTAAHCNNLQPRCNTMQHHATQVGPTT